MSAHDLHDEGALVRVGGADNGVDGLDDAVQRRVRPDRHVRAAEVIVYGSYHSSNVQELIFLPLVFSDLVVGQQLIKQAGPLLTEEVGSGEGTVSSNHHQVGDASGHQVVGGLETALSLAVKNITLINSMKCNHTLKIFYTNCCL